jgi:ATP-binding cassette subfamily B protein
MLIRLLRRYLRPYLGAITAVVALQLVGTIAALYLPSLNANIIDDGVAKGDTGYIVRVGAVMLGVTLLQIACSIAAVFLAARTAMRLGRDVRADLFTRVGTFSDREVQQFGTPSLITRSTNDVTQVQTMVVMAGTMLVIAPIMCVGGIIMALKQDLGLSWLIVVVVPLLVVSIGPVVLKMVPQFRLMQTKLDAVNRVLREQITGVRVVRAFVRERHETERFAVANTELTATALKVGKLMALMFPIVMLLMNGSSVAVMWFGGERIADGSMEVGSLTAFLSYLIQILMSVMMATFMMVMVPRAAVCAERIGEVLDTTTSVTPPLRPVTTDSRDGVVDFRHVTFSYPGADDPVLHDVTFTARPGRTTAIIGSTGSGKTTLLSLIPRLMDATSGSVMVDGVDVRDLAPDDLWSRMSLVPQRAYLFTGTVASNLRYGKSDATDE